MAVGPRPVDGAGDRGAARVYAQPVFAAPGDICTACEDEDPHTWKVWYVPYDYYICDNGSRIVGYAISKINPNDYVELKYSDNCRTIWAKQFGSGFDFGVHRESPAKSEY